MSAPTVHENIGHTLLVWEEEQLRIIVRRVRVNQRDGNVTGQITITSDAPSFADNHHLHESGFNFTSASARRTLAKDLGERYQEFDWSRILEQLCKELTHIVRRGEPAVEIYTNEDVEPPKYLLYPLLPLNLPTIVFGDSGVGKSEFALVVATCVRLPWRDNTLGFEVGEEGGGVLYLDFETDKSDIAWRLKCLQRGFNLPDFSIHHRYSTLSLADDIEQIQEIISQKKVKLIIVDSLGAACGGDLNAADVALRFFNALRSLKTTTLIIAHTSKDPNVKQKTIFGSAFFKAAARSVWECRKAQETGEDDISIALFHQKANISKLHQPIGFKFSFETDKTYCRQQDVKGVAEFRDALSAAVQIRDVLKRGAMSTEEIQDETALAKDTIRKTLNRMKDRGEVIKLGTHKWGLASHEE
ncbi:MAG TPA: AAA family ATPase [Dehalococcoidia bacterium]|nr:AAA family ATPase [Dehalococcoidia bacterium]